MTTSPISANIIARFGVHLLVSPLTIVIAVPRIDLIAGAATGTIPLSNFPAGELTEITAANAEHLGAIPPVGPATLTPLARAAYDFIEAGANAHVFALPFPVTAGHTAAERNAEVVTVLGAVLDRAMPTAAKELAKLPPTGVDLIVVPGETAVGTGADNVYARLETLCAPGALQCVALVDAGDVPYDNDMRPGATVPTSANVKLWSAMNRNIAVYSFSNRSDVANYNSMWGSVIAAAHHARYVSRNGIWAHPFNLRDPALGLAAISPPRVFDPDDGSSEAVALERDDKVGSIVRYDGEDFLWGAESFSAVVDPRAVLANHIVANRMIKRARRTMARFLKLRGRGSNLESLRLSIQKPLQDIYVPEAIQDVQVRKPVLTSNALKVEMPTAFYQFIDSIALTAEVYHGEVA